MSFKPPEFPRLRKFITGRPRPGKPESTTVLAVTDDKKKRERRVEEIADTGEVIGGIIVSLDDGQMTIGRVIKEYWLTRKSKGKRK